MDKYSVVVVDLASGETVFSSTSDTVIAMAASDDDVRSFFKVGSEEKAELLISAAEEIFAGAEGEE